MNLLDIVERTSMPEPWDEGEKIPWDDPDFSQRMLREHLSQAHDAASRRFETVDRHVAWIDTTLLGGAPGKILDLCCGPGLYTGRLAALGHTCVGIDFAPASIDYARAEAAKAGTACTYVHADVRRAVYGSGYHLAMLLYGEFNVFTRQDARTILTQAHQALAPGGRLLLEPHTLDTVRRVGQRPPSWYSSSGGLFSEQPHLCLEERFWDTARQVTTERYYVVDARSGAVTRHASSMQAYTDADYCDLLDTCGFEAITFYPALAADPDTPTGDLCAIVATRREA